MDTTTQLLNYLDKRYAATNKGKKLNDKTLLLEEKVIDSVGMLELVAFVEKSFDIEVPDEDITPDHFGTIGQLANYIEKGLR
jgi:acyl carrier protein